MPRSRLTRFLCVAFFLAFAGPLSAAIQLVPVLSSGLASPVFVGHAGDGSNRLFIVEQGGTIKVLQSGAASTTTFLDIHAKLVAGGEQGLLGLAFHPQYAANGRFFVYYTRAGDGTIVVAEYHVSTNRDVADTVEKVLLTIPHPTNTNHNGGMLAFGPDGFLYIGVGDGGSGNDPPNNAQNVNVLLGKILRIDVDHADATAGTPYSAPAGNPFVGKTGADEIFAYGWRNPWRFSFDRATGAQWVADVGQGAREEVDSPVVAGGNYGWRVYEGSACTGNDPALCTPGNYIFPLFDYTHVNGRCSITGGYVYRGTQGALPQGTYVYGDYCSGEIFTWDGVAQTLQLDTTQNVSSFGEDEQGEIYVVNLGGSLSRIASTTQCSFSVTPGSQSFGAAGGDASASVTATAGCPWTASTATPWLRVTAGASGSGNGTVTYHADANTTTSARNGSLTIAGRTLTVTQAAAAPCTYTIAPTRVNVGGAGATGTVTVTTGAGCPWTAVSNDAWITLTGATGGSGGGAVSYAVASYAGPSKNRTGTVTVAGQTFMIRQTKNK